MKNHQLSLVAFACLAGAGLASAQTSTVTIFGVVDAMYEHIGGTTASVSRLHSGGLAPSRIGFRGVEDLGGGLSASFWLEAAVNGDNGTGAASNTNNQPSGSSPAPAGTQGLTFNRRSTLSLAGSWGELRMGRDFSPHFWNTALYDPFGLTGIGTNQVINSSSLTGPLATASSIRTSNGASYFLPSGLGGLYGQAQVAFGENASGTSASRDGDVRSVRLGLASGPLDIAVAYGKTRFSTGDFTVTNLGASYKFSLATLMGGYFRNKVGTTPAVNGKGYLIGTAVPIGVGQFRASYATYKIDTSGEPTTSKIAIGYLYNLSKRTAVYGTFARVGNSGGASQTPFGPSGGVSGGAANAANASSAGYDVGVKHSF